ncbi:hypothetical protein FRC12_007633, partial [Ceratobasidium sp. 428]
MKKRAIKPTATTFHILSTAYARAAPEILTSLQLDRAQKIYKDWSDLISSEEVEVKGKRVIRSHPAAAYIDVLANAGEYQKIWEVYYELEGQGSLAPNEHVFTSMFIALAKRVDGAEISPTERHNASTQSAQDATLIWRNVLRAVEQQP